MNKLRFSPRNSLKLRFLDKKGEISHFITLSGHHSNFTARDSLILTQHILTLIMYYTNILLSKTKFYWQTM
jgi:hypothetical protein